MVDPDVAAAIQGNSITTPDILRVELGDVDVLNDYIGHTIRKPEPSASDDTSTAHADDAFVGFNMDGVYSGVIICNSNRRVVTAPVVGIDGQLTAGCSTPGSAAGLSGSAFGASEVELPVQDDSEGLFGFEVPDQLVSRGWGDGRTCGASSCAGCKARSFADDILCQSSGCDGGKRQNESR